MSGDHIEIRGGRHLQGAAPRGPPGPQPQNRRSGRCSTACCAGLQAVDSLQQRGGLGLWGVRDGVALRGRRQATALGSVGPRCGPPVAPPPRRRFRWLEPRFRGQARVPSVLHGGAGEGLRPFDPPRKGQRSHLGTVDRRPFVLVGGVIATPSPPSDANWRMRVAGMAFLRSSGARRSGRMGAHCRIPSMKSSAIRASMGRLPFFELQAPHSSWRLSR